MCKGLPADLRRKLDAIRLARCSRIKKTNAARTESADADGGEDEWSSAEETSVCGGGDARQGWHRGWVRAGGEEEGGRGRLQELHGGEEEGGERDRGLHVGEEEGRERDRRQGWAGRGGVYVDELKRVLCNRASVPRDVRYVPEID